MNAATQSQEGLMAWGGAIGKAANVGEALTRQPTKVMRALNQHDAHAVMALPKTARTDT